MQTPDRCSGETLDSQFQGATDLNFFSSCLPSLFSQFTCIFGNVIFIICFLKCSIFSYYPLPKMNVGIYYIPLTPDFHTYCSLCKNIPEWFSTASVKAIHVQGLRHYAYTFMRMKVQFYYVFLVFFFLQLCYDHIPFLYNFCYFPGVSKLLT